MYKYQNITDMDLTLVGLGVLKAGETVVSRIKIENPNLKLIESTETEKPVETPVAETSADTTETDQPEQPNNLTE